MTGPPPPPAMEAMEAEATMEAAAATERFRRERSSVANLTRINLIFNLRHRRSEVTVFTPFCLFVNLAENFGKIVSVGKLVCLFIRCRNLFRHLSCSVALRVFLFVNLAKILARLFRSVSWFFCFFGCLFVCLYGCMDVYMFVCLSTLFFRSVDINSRWIFIIFGQMVKG